MAGLTSSLYRGRNGRPLVMGASNEQVLRGLLQRTTSLWAFDNANGFDVVGSNTMANSGALPATGRVGTGAATNSSAFYTKTSPVNVDFGLADFGVACWFNTAASNYGLVSRWSTSDNHRIWTLLIEAGVGKFGVSTDGAATAIATVGSGLDDNAWHLLFGWRSLSDGKIWVQVDNGTPSSTTFSAASSLHSFNVTMALGALNGAGTYSANGVLDQAIILNGAPTDIERAAFWNEGAGISLANMLQGR